MDQETPAAAPAPGIDIGEYLAVFKRRWLTILIPAVLCLFIGAALGFLLPPVYEEGTIFSVRDLSFEQGQLNPVGRMPEHRDLFSIPAQEIKNPDFLAPLVSRIGITEGKDFHDSRERQELWDKIMKNLSVDYAESKDAKKPDVIGITYKGRNPGRVVAFVNAIRNKFIDQKNEEYRRKVAGVRQDIKTELARAEAELDRTNEDLSSFLILHGLEDAGEDSERRLIDKWNAEKDKLETLRAQSEEKAKALESLRRQLLSEPTEQRSSTRQVSEAWTTADAEAKRLKRLLDQLRVRFFDTHPDVQKAQRDWNAARVALNGIQRYVRVEVTASENKRYTELKSKIDALDTEIAALQVKVETSEKREDELRLRVEAIPTISKDLSEKRATAEIAQDRFERVGRRLKEAEFVWDLVVKRKESLTRTIFAPNPEEAYSKDPIFPKMSLFLMLGIVLGVLLGIGIAFLTEFSAQAWLSSRQIRRGLGVPLLGELASLETLAEKRRRFRRRLIVGALLAGVAGVVGWIHLCYFSADLRPNLPPWLFDFLKKIYGKA